MTMIQPNRRGFLAGLLALGVAPTNVGYALPVPGSQRVWVVSGAAFSLAMSWAVGITRNLDFRYVSALSEAQPTSGDVVMMTEPGACLAQREALQSLMSQGVVVMVLSLDARSDGAAAECQKALTLTSLHVVSSKALRADGDAFFRLASNALIHLSCLVPITWTGWNSESRPQSLESAACDRTMRFMVYKPSGPGPFPVMLLLHGAWGQWSDWPLQSGFELARLVSETGMAVVCPDGLPFSWYLDSPKVGDSQVATYIMKELILAIQGDASLRGPLSIGGLSMGGHGAGLLAMKHPGIFHSVSSMSGAISITAFPKHPRITKVLGPYVKNKSGWQAHDVVELVKRAPDVAQRARWMFSCGTSDRWWGSNQRLHEVMKAAGVKHEWRSAEGVGHTWDFWKSELERHVRWHAAGVSR